MRTTRARARTSTKHPYGNLAEYARSTRECTEGYPEDCTSSTQKPWSILHERKRNYKTNQRTRHYNKRAQTSTHARKHRNKQTGEGARERACTQNAHTAHVIRAARAHAHAHGQV
jgi:hypothetical protein